MPLLRQLEMGMSMSRYFPATGTAGLARSWVSGKSRAPCPPPRIKLRPDRCCMGLGSPRGAVRTMLADARRRGKTPHSSAPSAGQVSSHSPGENDGLLRAVVHGHTVVRVAADEQARKCGHPGLDPLDPLQMAD